MALEIIITDAGRAALVNAQNTGTNPVLIASVGVSAQAIVATKATAALAGEIKRIGTLSGDVVADDTIHLTVRDETADQYSIRSFALYLADGTLFGAYGQAGAIMEKSAQSLLLLAIDVRFVDIAAPNLTFGDANFLNPPATVDRQGVVELATNEETTAGVDPERAVTPKGLKVAVAQWLDDRLGALAPSAFVKTLLLAATAAAFRTSLAIKSAALKDEGSGKGLDADLLDGQHGAWYSDIPARLGYTPWHLNNDGAGSGLDADLVRGTTPSAFGLARLADADAPAARAGLGISAANTPFTPGGAIAAGNVQAALAELDTKKAALSGAAFTGNVSVGGSVGALTILSVSPDGDARGGAYLQRATGNGILAFTNAAGVRQGYIGFKNGTRLALAAEGAATGWAVTGDMTISNGLTVTGALTVSDTASFTKRTSHEAGISVRSGGGIQINNPANTAGFSINNDGTNLTFSAGIAVTGAISVTGAITQGGNQVWHAGNDAPLAKLAGAAFTGNISTSGGIGAGSTIDAQTPNDATTGGVRIRGNATSGNAFLQFTNSLANAEWANLKVTAGGAGVWSGTLTVAGAITRAGNTVWDAGNDGSGSGLDADLLDGQHGDFWRDWPNLLNKPATFPPAAHTHGAADIAGAFTGTKAQNGYVTLPNGLIIQWGRFTATANASTNVFFPIVFPNACFSVAAAGGSSGATDSKDNPPVLLANSIAAHLFQVFTADDTNGACAYIAIGY